MRTRAAGHATAALFYVGCSITADVHSNRAELASIGAVVHSSGANSHSHGAVVHLHGADVHSIGAELHSIGVVVHAQLLCYLFVDNSVEISGVRCVSVKIKVYICIKY